MLRSWLGRNRSHLLPRNDTEMKFVPSMIGIFAAGLVLLVLTVTRLVHPALEIPSPGQTEITMTTLPEPPPPIPEDPPPQVPSPPMALPELSMVSDPARIAIPRAAMPMRLDIPVDPFFTDVAPPPLPAAPRPLANSSIRSKPSPGPRPQPPSLPPSRPRPPRVTKSIHQSYELDSTPRCLRHGWATFPSSLSRQRISRGTVVLEVELSERGSVSVRRVVSSSHPELIAVARRIAKGAQFTPPTKNGLPVKAIMNWPVTILNK